MGRAAAIAFAREGADVAINYLPQEEPDAQEVVQLISAEGRKAAPIAGDIRDEAFCRHLVSEAAERLGGLDILVSNAARQISQDSILDITTEQFDTTLKTNFYAMFWITKAAIPHMGSGSAIIYTASVNAYEPGKNIIGYAATKGAIMIWSKGLAKQLAPKGIRVNAVARAGMDPAAGDRWPADGRLAEVRRRLAARTSGPTRRIGGALCAPGLAGGELLDRSGDRRRRRPWWAVIGRKA
jgi:NAD(P)-dependent dehydrogenase (short-subunit alcohol dehydrogenase family)